MAGSNTDSIRMRRARHLAARLLCAAAVTTACFDFHSGGGGPPRDCINQFGGTDRCGPTWDSDGDTISTATEANPTNRIGNFPIAGFYTFDTLTWNINSSIANGDSTNGQLTNGMNLKDTGPGYDHSGYRGCDGVDDDDWGTGHLVRFIEASGRDWAYLLSPFSTPRIQTGDMSLRMGGQFATCGDPHAWHRNGLDVDIRYIKKVGAEGALDICDANQKPDYDTLATLDLFDVLAYYNGDGKDGRPLLIWIFADTTCLGFGNHPDDPYIRHDTGHRNHFHVRIRDPDGPNN